MRTLIIVLISFLILSIPSFAQRNRGKAKFDKEFVCPTIQAEAQHSVIGIGGKLGDPIGLTIKGFFPKGLSLEVVAGGANSRLNDFQYQKTLFETYRSDSDYEFFGVSEMKLMDRLAIQGRILIHNSFPDNGIPGLVWYTGLGVHTRFFSTRYQYGIDTGGSENEFGAETIKYTEMGPEAILGFEFAVGRLPISLFAEVTYYYQMYSEFTWHQPGGGIGLRFTYIEY